jgi:hypothetical protein
MQLERGLGHRQTRDPDRLAIARVSSCFGKGSRKLVGHEFLGTSRVAKIPERLEIVCLRI